MGNGRKNSFINSLGGKILILFMLVGGVAAGGLAIISINESSKSLEKAASVHLDAMGEIKEEQIQSFLERMNTNLEVMSNNIMIQNKLTDFDSAFMAAGDSIDSDEWRVLAQKNDDFFKKKCESYGIDDIYFMCPEGSIVYTYQKRADLGQFVTELPLKDSSFGDAFYKLQKNPSLKIAFGAFRPYSPAGGDGLSFFVARMKDPETSEIIGHLGFAFSGEGIDKIMQKRSGMGETGESYLVGFDDDGTTSLRSDRVIKSGEMFDKKSDSIIEKCLNEGASGIEMKIGSTGDKELVVYDPIELPGGIRWGLFTTMAKDEIDQPVNALIVKILITAFIVLVSAVFIALLFANSIRVPLSAGVEIANRIAARDLTVKIDSKYLKRKDEIGALTVALHDMKNSLSGMMTELNTGMGSLAAASTELLTISGEMSRGADMTTEKAGTVAAASEELNANSASVAVGIEQSSVNLNSVASATEEMTATINQIVQNTDSARTITEQAVEQSKQVTELMDVLGESANEIGKVTETIASISDQTNLLALNATIEAARAGEAGKGFAVVASEIKDLAKQTAEATEDIRQKIEGIQVSTNNSIVDIKRITEIVQKVNDYVTTIAEAVDEQAITTKDIADNMGQASIAVHDAAERTAQNSTVSQDIAKEISGVSTSADEMSVSGSQVEESAKELSHLSEMLKAMVDTYKL